MLPTEMRMNGQWFVPKTMCEKEVYYKVASLGIPMFS